MLSGLINWDLLGNPCKEVTHQSGYLRVMALKGEMAAGYEMYFGIRQIALESCGTCRDERRVVLTPDGQQRRLIGAEILLKLRVEGDVGTIVKDEVVLYLIASWLADIVVIE